MNIKSVIFDFNGTMFYDGEFQETSLRLSNINKNLSVSYFRLRIIVL